MKARGTLTVGPSGICTSAVPVTPVISPLASGQRTVMASQSSDTVIPYHASADFVDISVAPASVPKSTSRVIITVHNFFLGMLISFAN
jgi:hypothetical protein